jgi:hypothetical protein
MLPPFNLSDTEFKTAMRIIEKVARKLEKEHQA